MRRLALAAALALSLASCGGTGKPAPASPSAPPARPRVRLQLNWFPEPEFGGIYAAMERGVFAKHGIDVELLQGGADVPAPQLLASGHVELAVMAAEQVLTLRAHGGRVKAVFASFQRSPRCIVVKADSPHATLADLWSSKATVLAQDGLTFVKWLNRAHGGKNLSFVPYAGSAAPLISGTVDAMQGFATAEPVQLQLENVNVRTFVVADEGFNPYDVVIAANEDFLAKDPETVTRMVDALREGWRSYLDDPAPINAVMAQQNLDMKMPVMQLSAVLLPAYVESDATREHGLGWMDPARWEQLAQQLHDVGDLDAPVDSSTAFVNLRDHP